jgi:hypothetical protein
MRAWFVMLAWVVGCGGSKGEDTPAPRDTDASDPGPTDTDAADTDAGDTDAADTDAADTDATGADTADTAGPGPVVVEPVTPATLLATGFELPDLGGPERYDGLTPPGWTRESGDGTMSEGTFRPGTASMFQVEPLAYPGGGVQCVVVSAGSGGGTTVDAVHRLISGDLALVEEGRTYTVRAAVGARKDVWGGQTFVSVLADGVVVAQTDLDLRAANDGVFREVSVVWVGDAATAGRPLRVAVGLTLARGSGVTSAVFDEVTVDVE